MDEKELDEAIKKYGTIFETMPDYEEEINRLTIEKLKLEIEYLKLKIRNLERC